MPYIKIVLLTALLSCWGWGIEAQNMTKMESQQKDSTAIAQTLETTYFQGIYTGDVNALSQIYHPGTLLFGDVKGQPYAKTLAQYLDGVKKPAKP